MQKALLFKIAIVLLLAFLINIPLGMMSNLVDERQGRQNQVSADIANSYTEPQFIAGPLLVFPYTEVYTTRQETHDSAGNRSATRERIERCSATLLLMPHNLTATG